MSGVEFGVFLPVGEGGFIMSTTRPPAPATYEYNRQITRLADDLGLGFVISLAKWRGFGGETGHNDRTLEAVATTAGLAEATARIRVFATMHTMAYHPAVAAKMLATIDQVSQGRVGLNLVAGSNPVDHGQMGIWRDLPHDELYAVAAEWMTVVQRLWTEDRVDFEGEYYRLADCLSNPKPIQQPRPPVLCAATSDRGMRFTIEHCDASLVNGTDLEDLKRNGLRSKELAAEMGKTARTVGLVMLVPGETEAEARARVDLYDEGADVEAIQTRIWEFSAGAREWSREVQAAKEQRRAFTTEGKPLAVTKNAVIGTVDSLVDQLVDVVEGGQFDWLGLYLPDYIADLEIFGREILPRLADKGLANPPGTAAPLVPVPE